MTGFGILVFFTNVMEFQVRYLVLFPFFSVIDCFGWFWMGSLHRNIQLMLEFLKAVSLVLHFFLLYSFFTFFTFFFLFFTLSLPLSLFLSLSLCLLGVWSGIWSVATTRIGFWTWIWSTRHYGLGQEVACWFQCWKKSTCFVWPV